MKQLLLRILLLSLLFTSTAVYAQSYDPERALVENMMAIPLGLLSLLAFLAARWQQGIRPKKQIGFYSITPNRKRKFYPVGANITNMEPVVAALADSDIHVYSNLNKITLNARTGGIYLEEKNYKISILVNRRRTRRCFLKDGDILDMGELTLMFSTPDSSEENTLESSPQPESAQFIPRNRKVKSKLLSSHPSLVPADNRKKTHHLTGNITYIGRSEMNDLVSKAKGVSPRHSKIEKVAGRYKIVDLGTPGGTYINGRRVENKYLKEGDIVSFESVKYTFSLTGKTR
ncbi:MAG: FHA domain-containing protein [SAR324 cluster bacterium]|nr:FHA domain-containing protein [SAR324 cluster bacterium]